jgi:hypothetical protein
MAAPILKNIWGGKLVQWGAMLEEIEYEFPTNAHDLVSWAIKPSGIF